MKEKRETEDKLKNLEEKFNSLLAFRLRESNSTIVELKEKVEGLSKSNTSIESQMKERMASLQEAIKLRKVAEDAKKEIVLKFTEKSNELEVLGGELNALKLNINESESKRKEAELSLISKSVSLMARESELGDLRSKLDGICNGSIKINENKELTPDDRNTLVEKIKLLELNKSQIQNKLDDIIEEKSESDKFYTHVNAQLEEANSKVYNLNMHVNVYKKENNEMKLQMQILQEENEKSDKLNKEIISELRLLHNDYEEQEVEMGKLHENINLLKKEQKDNILKNTELNEKVEDYNNKIKTLEEMNKIQKEENTNVESSYNNYLNLYNSANTLTQELQSKLEISITSNEQANLKITELDIEINKNKESTTTGSPRLKRRGSTSTLSLEEKNETSTMLQKQYKQYSTAIEQANLKIAELQAVANENIKAKELYNAALLEVEKLKINLVDIKNEADMIIKKKEEEFNLKLMTSEEKRKSILNEKNEMQLQLIQAVNKISLDSSNSLKLQNNNNASPPTSPAFKARAGPPAPDFGLSKNVALFRVKLGTRSNSIVDTFSPVKNEEELKIINVNTNNNIVDLVGRGEEDENNLKVSEITEGRHHHVPSPILIPPEQKHSVDFERLGLSPVHGRLNERNISYETDVNLYVYIYIHIFI